MVVLGGDAFSYERGTPVLTTNRQIHCITVSAVNSYRGTSPMDSRSPHRAPGIGLQGYLAQNKPPPPP